MRGSLILLVIVISAVLVNVTDQTARSEIDAAQIEVRSAVKRLIDGWREADPVKVRAVLHRDFRLVTLRESSAGPQAETESLEHLLQSVDHLKPGNWDDRLQSEEVRIADSGIATVWARYEFYVDGKRTHCGTELFQLYHMSDGWKIINFADTHGERYCKK